MQRRDRDHHLLQRLGHRVRTLRETTGKSQEDLAHEADVHRTYLSGVERGVRNPSLTTLARIAAALGVSLAVVVEGLNLDMDSEHRKETPNG